MNSRVQEVLPRAATKAANRKVATVPPASIQAACRTINHLARVVADEVRRSIECSPEPPADHPHEVLLDKEVNGFRLVVVRTRVASGSGVSLSPREIEIARMIAKGYPNKTIAAVLEISTWTVGTHLRRIFAKLGVTSRAAMVTRVIESELTESRVPEPR